MLAQNLLGNNYAKMGRFFQAIFLLLALWSFYWAHIHEMFVWNKTFIESISSSLSYVLLYSLSLFAIISFEFYFRRIHRVSTTSSQNVEYTLANDGFLNHAQANFQKKPSKTIGGLFIIPGALLLISSFIMASTILAFIGLSLTFWGAILFYARSTNFVPSNVVMASTFPSYVTLDRIISDIDCTGKAIYLPPYPKDSYLPEYLSGIKDLVVFVSIDDSVVRPPIEAIGQKRFMIKDPDGIFITPPGSGILAIFEKQLNLDFSKINKEQLYEYLPNLTVEVLEFASKFEVDDENRLVHVKITNSVYQSLYSKEHDLTSVLSVGCPLVSAIACALAKTTGKSVVISKSNISLDLQNIEFWYRIVEG